MTSKYLKPAAIILALVLISYSNTFGAAYFLDDYHQAVDNHLIKYLHLIPKLFVTPGLGSSIARNTGYRPITYASFSINYAISGSNVWSYHVFNILLHFLNCFLAFLIVRAILKRSGDLENRSSVPIFTALVFALHPIQTAAVTYISGRAGMLAAFFAMLSFLLFVRSRDYPDIRKRCILFFLSALAFLAGLLAKENAVVLVGFVALYETLFSGGTPSARAKRVLLSSLPFLLVLAFYLGIKKVLQGYFSKPDELFGTGVYLMSEAKVILLYMRLMLFPMNQNSDYDLTPVRSVDGGVIVSALFIVLLLVLIYRIGRRDKAVAFFGGWFFIALFPECSFIPITDIAVEYRLYLPSLGLIAASIILLNKATGRLRYRKIAAAIVVILFCVLTFARNSVWATEGGLVRDVLKKAPYSARAHGNYAYFLLEHEDYDGAIKEIGAALKIGSPLRFIDYYNLGVCYYHQGKTEAAAESFMKSIKDYPDSTQVYEKLGEVYFESCRYADAAGIFLKETERFKGDPQAHYNLALSYMMLGRNEDATEQALMALKYFEDEEGKKQAYDLIDRLGDKGAGR